MVVWQWIFGDWDIWLGRGDVGMVVLGEGVVRFEKGRWRGGVEGGTRVLENIGYTN